MSDEVIDAPEMTIDPDEEAAVAAEQEALDIAILRAQVQHLSMRVAELARENVRLRKDN